MHTSFDARLSIPDTEFCRQIGVTDSREASGVALIRRLLEKVCKLRPGTLYPSDTPENVLSRACWFDGWDEVSFLFELEDELHVTLTSSFELPSFQHSILGLIVCNGPTTLGPWVGMIAKRLSAMETVVFPEGGS